MPVPNSISRTITEMVSLRDMAGYNEQYKNTGIICEQEKEIITTMIKSIKETISYEFLNELLN